MSANFFLAKEITGSSSGWKKQLQVLRWLLPPPHLKLGISLPHYATILFLEAFIFRALYNKMNTENTMLKKKNPIL